MILVIILQALFAFCFVIFKKTLAYGEPFFLVGLRMLLSGVVLLTYSFFVAKQSIRYTRNVILFILLGAVFNVYITNAFELWGLQYVSAAKTSFIYNFSPFLAAFFSYLFLQETLTPKKWLGLLLGFIGFIPVLIAHSPQELSTCMVGFISVAEMAIIAAAIATALGWVAIKKLVYDERVPVAFANGSTMLLGGILSMANSMAIETWSPLPSNDLLAVLAYTVLGASLSCLFCYNLYTILLKRYSATFMSFSGLLTPLVTAVAGWFLLGETITWYFVLSFCLVSLGLFIFYMDEIKKKA